MSTDPKVPTEVKLPSWARGGTIGNSSGIKAKKQERRVASKLGGSRRGRSNQLWHKDAALRQTVKLVDNGAEVTTPSPESIRPIGAGLGRNRGSANRRVTDRGDVRTASLHVEHKFTEKKSITISREWLDKVTLGATQQGKDPALVITFIQTSRSEEDWALIPLDVLERLTKRGQS